MKKEIKQFIEDAIAGGFTATKQSADYLRDSHNLDIRWIFLEPKAWKAVGKTRGWGKPKECIIDGRIGTYTTTAECEASGFFGAIMAGDTIEKALRSIEK
jgi:hypothetical protein